MLLNKTKRDKRTNLHDTRETRFSLNINVHITRVKKSSAREIQRLSKYLHSVTRNEGKGFFATLSNPARKVTLMKNAMFLAK